MVGDRHIGKLCFLKHGAQENIKVFWKVFQGGFKQSSWKAIISFSEDFTVPDKASDLFFEAIDDTTIQVMLELEDGTQIDCVIHSIADLTDEGVIEISSPNLGRVGSIPAQK